MPGYNVFNDLPSSRRGHLSVVSFMFFLFFFAFIRFVFFLPILFGVSFKILGLFVHMYLFVCFFFVKILVRFSLFFLEGI